MTKLGFRATFASQFGLSKAHENHIVTDGKDREERKILSRISCEG